MPLVSRLFGQLQNNRNVRVKKDFGARQTGWDNSGESQPSEAESVKIIMKRMARLLGQLSEEDRQKLLREARKMSTH